MGELEDSGWKADTAKESEDMADMDMKNLLQEADNQRRNSKELIVEAPRRVSLLSVLSKTKFP